jgi:hypothetical protein
MALGAEFGDIASLVYRGTLAPAAVGLAFGMAAVTWLTRLLRAQFAGVSAGNAKPALAAGLILLAIAILAATGPAVRAAWSDPARVLRRP